jgi:hypothetical protein
MYRQFRRRLQQFRLIPLSPPILVSPTLTTRRPRPTPTSSCFYRCLKSSIDHSSRIGGLPVGRIRHQPTTRLLPQLLVVERNLLPRHAMPRAPSRRPSFPPKSTT